MNYFDNAEQEQEQQNFLELFGIYDELEPEDMPAPKLSKLYPFMFNKAMFQGTNANMQQNSTMAL